MYLTERERHIAAGRICAVPELASMYRSRVVAPTWAQPWHASDKGLRMHSADKARALHESLTSIVGGWVEADVLYRGPKWVMPCAN